MKVDNYKCDICGQMKQPSNGWSIGYANISAEIRFHARGTEMTAPKATIIVPWSEMAANTPEAQHLCGVECITKFVAKQVAK